MKPTLLIRIMPLLFLAGTAYGLEDTVENRRREAERYLQATPPREMLAGMAEQVSKSVASETPAVFQELLLKHIDVEAFTNAIRHALVRNFTAAELGALADFYGSSLGKSAMKKFGAYMADITPLLQSEIAKAMEKVNRDLAEGRAR